MSNDISLGIIKVYEGIGVGLLRVVMGIVAGLAIGVLLSVISAMCIGIPFGTVVTNGDLLIAYKLSIAIFPFVAFPVGIVSMIIGAIAGALNLNWR